MKMKKVTQKDRYGNQVSYEYESDTKQLDLTTLFEKLLDKEIPEYYEIPESSPIGGGVQIGFAPTHPGEPRGQDTVPAWLTPGEFVVNKEAMDDPQNAAMVEQINNQGRAIQQAKGGMVPEYYIGGGLAGAGKRVADRPDPRLQNVDWFKQGGKWYNHPGIANMSEGEKRFKEAIENKDVEALQKLQKHFPDFMRRKRMMESKKYGPLFKKYGLGDTENPIWEGGTAEERQKIYEDLYKRANPSWDTELSDEKSKWRGKRIPEQDSFVEELLNKHRAGSPFQLNDGDTDMYNIQDPAVQRMIQGGFKGLQTYDPSLGIHSGVDLEGPVLFQEGGDVPELPMSPIETLLRAREGFRPDVYEDTRGYPTVGHGHRLPDEYLQRIGEQPFSTGQLDSMFYEDMDSAEAAAKRNAKSYGVKWGDLNKREKTALTSMAFQLGEQGQKNFENMWTKLAAGDKEGAALEALDSDWATQTPQRAKDVYDSLTPGLGFNAGGPIYAYRGYDVAQQDAFDIEDPNADLSGGWLPPVYGENEISPMEQAILDEEAAAPPPPGNIGGSPITSPDLQQAEVWEKQYAGRDPDDVGFVDGPPAPAAEEEVPWWEGITDWAFGEEGTAVARDRNEKHAVLVEKANVEAAQAEVDEIIERRDNNQPVGANELKAAEEVLEHQQSKLADAETAVAKRAGEIDYEGVVAAEAELMHSNKPGPEDDKAALEELAKSSEYENEDDASKPSDKGQQHPDEVVAKGEQSRKENPELFDTAKGFFKDAFSDLFDGKELARMAIMYMGSRALGYSHGGSLNWAAKQYVNRLDAKSDHFSSMVESGKYTKQSLAQYRKTGDVLDLVPAGSPAEPTGNQKTFFSPNGQKIMAQEVKVGDGKYWVDGEGNRINLNTHHSDPSMVPGTREYGDRIKADSKQYEGMISDLRTQFGTIDKEKNIFATELAPGVAGNKVAKWAINNNIPPEYMGQIIEGAYHQAIADSQGSDTKVRDLTPYLEQQYVTAKVGDPTLFVKPDGKPVNSQKLNGLLDQVEGVARLANPQFQGPSSAITTAAIQEYRAAWNALDAETKKQYQALPGESAFMNFIRKDLEKAAAGG